MASPQHRQAELDRFAKRRGWSTGPFRSWRFHGFTIAVSATSEPKQAYTAARGPVRKGFAYLSEAERWVAYVVVTGSEPADASL